MAQLVNHGGVMYRDAVDHKPPGLVYFYAGIEKLLGSNSGGYPEIAGVHFAGILLAVLTGVGLYLVSRELIRRDLAWLPPALYGIVTTTKCAYDGLAVNGELLMNLPTVFAVLLVIRGRALNGWRRHGSDFLAGALVGIAGLFKWQALITGLAFPFLAGWGQGAPCREGARDARADGGLPESWKALGLSAIFWLFGVSAPLLLVSGYFYRIGIFRDAWRWGALFNLVYIADGSNPAWVLRRLLIQLGAVVLPSLVFYGVSLKAMMKGLGGGGGRLVGVAAWSLVALVAVCVGGRFFGHYFLQAELPLSILAAEPIHRLHQRAPWRTLAAIGVPAAFFFLLSLSPVLTRALFDPGAPDWARVGREIAERSSSGDRLFVWGNVPPLYYYSHREMGTRFSFCNYLTGLSPATPSEYGDAETRPSVSWAWPMLLEDLKRRKPELILDTSAAGWKGYGKYPLLRYPLIANYIESHYHLDSRVDGAVLYRRTRRHRRTHRRITCRTYCRTYCVAGLIAGLIER